jgi:hypothetical protein
MKKVLFVSLALAGLSVLSVVRATVITENFSSDPLQNGWQVFGDTNLFQWDSTNHNLVVTWDSSQPNSYFYHPLGTILAIDDDFSVSFDLRLGDINDTGFEIAIGFLNFADATRTNFLRAGTNDFFPNMAEFDYFPSFGSEDATLSSTNSKLYFAYDNLSLDPGVTYSVVLTHAAGQAAISGNIYINHDDLYTSLPNFFSQTITNFHLDIISISSYSDAGQDPDFAGSILAHGTVDNFAVNIPPPPIQNLTGVLTNNFWQAQFVSRSNWLYTLQRAPDFQTWTNVSPATGGNATNLFLQDTNSLANKAFYRIRAERP